MEAYGLAIPSWLAAVGILMNGIDAFAEASLPRSISFPPPTASTIDRLIFLIISTIWLSEASVDSLTIILSTRSPAFDADNDLSRKLHVMDRFIRLQPSITPPIRLRRQSRTWQFQACRMIFQSAVRSGL